MSDDQFTTLFKYMERRFAAIENRLDQTVTKAEFNIFVEAVDVFAKRMEIYDHERLALTHQVSRHDHWIHELSQGTGIGLSPP